MNKFLTILLLGGLVTLATTCKKRECADGPDSNEGIIVDSHSFECNGALVNSGILIADTASFHQILPNDQLTIDFSKHSLLGIYVSGSSCKWKIVRSVTIKSNVNQYEYLVTVYKCGHCKKDFSDCNWVTVPKLPTGWMVGFDRQYIQE